MPVATRTPVLTPADSRLFSAARLRAARQQPYMAAALFSLVPIPEPGFGTFGVDRWWRVYVDFEVAHRWGVEQVAAVLLHEAHHVVRDHHRRGDRIGARAGRSGIWNLAGDAAINDDLLADGLALPDPVLPRHFGLPDGGFEEVYYRHLLEQADDTPAPSCGSGAGGAALAPEIDQDPAAPDAVDGVDEVDAAAVRRAVAHEVVAAGRSQQPVSPGLARWAQDLLTPQVPWRSLLRTALGRSVRAVTARAHPDWSRADRRADARPDFPRAGNRFVLPDLAVVVDTSGSMSRSLLDAAVTEINAILHRSGVRELTVVVCDALATRPQRVRRLGDLVLTGGGGTDLRVGIEAAARLRPEPTTIVVLTDGGTPWPAAAPRRTDLIAVVIGDEEPLPAGPGITSVRIAENG